MPILDLISQIEGGKPATKPALPARNSLVPPKRKAEDDARNGSTKSPRTSGPAPAAAAPLRSAPNPTATSSSRPTPPAGERKATIPQRPIPSKPPPKTRSTDRLSSLNLNGVRSGRISKSSGPPRAAALSAAATAAAAAAVGSGSNAPKAPPKKGSFLEVMARGQRAQELMGQIGKIQHKPIERAPKKDTKETAGKAPVKKPTLPGPGSLKRVGSVPLPSPRNGTASAPAAKNSRNGVEPQAKDSKNGTKPAEPEKKVRKAVVATTGYTGTARPKPGAASTTKTPGATARAGLVNPHSSKSGKPSGRSRYDDDDEDEDMDDFIEYDDDEDGGDRRRYDYDSDGSSDMEAGLDELDVEERQAERLAKIEDRREEEMERKAKFAKEERKKKALDSIRARRL